MSTTPRTDEQVLAYRTEDGSEMVHASFAAKLETELITACRILNDETNRAEKAEADTARMDWLEKEALEDWGIRSIDRATIDAAMKEASQ